MMKEPEQEVNPDIPELTDEEYAETYESGTGGHVLPPEVLADLNDQEGQDNG